LNHATRVLKYLDITECFDGMTFCDYSEKDFSCKPHLEFYEKALLQSQAIPGKTKCYLIDDSEANCKTAKKLNWTTVYVSPHKSSKYADYNVKNVKELKTVLPELFY